MPASCLSADRVPGGPALSSISPSPSTASIAVAWSSSAASTPPAIGLSDFHDNAALLTPDPVGRTQRLLAAARAKSDAGALDAAKGLLVGVEAGPVDARHAAEIELLRGQIALDQRRGGDAHRLLLNAARRLQPFSVDLARAAHLDALVAAVWANDLGSPQVREAAEAARNAPPVPAPPRVLDVLLDAVRQVWALQGSEPEPVAASGSGSVSSPSPAFST